MNELFGRYRPGDSVWHRMGVGWKYLAVLLLLVPALLVQRPWMTGAMLVLAAGVLFTTGGGVRTLRVPWALLLLLVVVGGYQLLTGRPDLAVVVAGNLLLAVWSSRLLIDTTPGTVLVDALIAAFRPFRVLGLDPERAGLAVAVMLRSVPVLLGAFRDVRDAARARGLERNLLVNVAPVVVQAVAYAQATGDALTARGLGEPRMGA